MTFFLCFEIWTFFVIQMWFPGLGEIGPGLCVEFQSTDRCAQRLLCYHLVARLLVNQGWAGKNYVCGIRLLSFFCRKNIFFKHFFLKPKHFVKFFFEKKIFCAFLKTFLLGFFDKKTFFYFFWIIFWNIFLKHVFETFVWNIFWKKNISLEFFLKPKHFVWDFFWKTFFVFLNIFLVFFTKNIFWGFLFEKH